MEEYVPDISSYTDAWVKLGIALRKQQNLEDRLDELRAEIMTEVRTNPEYYIGGRPPAVSHCEQTFMVNGHTLESKEEMLSLKRSLADLEKEITQLRGILKSEEMKLSVFQTMSANARERFSLDG